MILDNYGNLKECSFYPTTCTLCSPSCYNSFSFSCLHQPTLRHLAVSTLRHLIEKDLDPIIDEQIEETLFHMLDEEIYTEYVSCLSCILAGLKKDAFITYMYWPLFEMCRIIYLSV